MSKVLGIAQFAKTAKVEEATARVMLRSIGHPKKGRSYEFKSQSEIEALIAKIRKGGGKPKASKKKAPAKKKPKPKKKVKAASKEDQRSAEE